MDIDHIQHTERLPVQVLGSGGACVLPESRQKVGTMLHIGANELVRAAFGVLLEFLQE